MHGDGRVGQGIGAARGLEMAAALLQHIHEQFVIAIVTVRFVLERTDNADEALRDGYFIQATLSQRVANSHALLCSSGALGGALTSGGVGGSGVAAAGGGVSAGGEGVAGRARVGFLRGVVGLRFCVAVIERKPVLREQTEECAVECVAVLAAEMVPAKDAAFAGQPRVSSVMLAIKSDASRCHGKFEIG